MNSAKFGKIWAEVTSGDLTNAQLNELVEAIKFSRERLIRKNAKVLKVGDRVSFKSSKCGNWYPVKGVIVDIKIKNAIVETDSARFGRYRVPMNMLTVIEA